MTRRPDETPLDEVLFFALYCLILVVIFLMTVIL